MTSFDEIGQQFAQFYYRTFDENRTQVGQLYHDAAIMTFEGNRIETKLKISEHLGGLPFRSIQHVPTTVDCQPTEGGVLVLVNGQLKTDDDPPHSFSQLFVLRNLNGAWCVTNDLFRLNLHNFAA